MFILNFITGGSRCCCCCGSYDVDDGNNDDDDRGYGNDDNVRICKKPDKINSNNRYDYSGCSFWGVSNKQQQQQKKTKTGS